MNSPMPDSAGVMDTACETLMRAAIQAPSGDNTQPWRFVVDSPLRRIAVHLDESRDPSPMNTGQRMARLAIGAAVENMLQAAKSLGWTVQLEEPCNGASASLRIVDCPKNNRDILPAIARRGTNRREYDGRPLSEDLKADLASAIGDVPGINSIWIHERERVLALADLVGRADSLMLSVPSMRGAFLNNVRFDVSWDSVVDEGLSLGSLEIPATDRLALRVIRYLPDWLLRLGGAASKFAAAGRRLVASSAGALIITESTGTEQSELQAGRTVQRAWLALADRGVAVQPIMSLAVLEGVVCRGSPELVASLGRRQAEALLGELRKLIPEIGEAKLAFLMRFGYGPPPTVRTGRLKLSAMVSTDTARANCMSELSS